MLKRLETYRPFLLVLALLTGTADGAAASDYTVGEGDVIEVAVYDHPDLTTTARVDNEGFILFPLIGPVYVRDLPVQRVADVVGVLLADGYVVNPQVTVFVKEYRSIKVAVMGQVKNPGLFTAKGGTSFLEALSMAGGLTSGAGDRAAVTRVTGGQQTVDIDLVRLLEAGDASHDIPLLGGDSIYVEEASFFAVSGEVRNPGRYRFRDGITLEEALAMAGGLTDNASREGIVLTRETQEGTVDLETGSWEGDVGVLQGDRIHVSKRKSRVFYVTGEVGRPGSYSYEENLTVLKAITKAGGFSERASRGRVQIRRETDGGTKVLKKVGNDDPVLPEDVIVVPESFF